MLGAWSDLLGPMEPLTNCSPPKKAKKLKKIKDEGNRFENVDL